MYSNSTNYRSPCQEKSSPPRNCGYLPAFRNPLDEELIAFLFRAVIRNARKGQQKRSRYFLEMINELIRRRNALSGVAA